MSKHTIATRLDRLWAEGDAAFERELIAVLNAAAEFVRSGGGDMPATLRARLAALNRSPHMGLTQAERDRVEAMSDDQLNELIADGFNIAR